MKKPNTKCDICGKPFYRAPKYQKETKWFCCREHRSELYKKHPEIVKNLDKGHGWNKDTPTEQQPNYGSKRSEETKKQMSISAKIAKPVNPANHIIVKCMLCGNKIKTYKSNYLRGNARFCSKRCFAIHKNLTQRTTGTDIENIIENWLKEKSINYKKQNPIKNITIPDFFIEPNVCVYCDGDYWHTIPKVSARDKWINDELIKDGYRVIRLWGTEIKKGIRPQI